MSHSSVWLHGALLSLGWLTSHLLQQLIRSVTFSPLMWSTHFYFFSPLFHTALSLICHRNWHRIHSRSLLCLHSRPWCVHFLPSSFPSFSPSASQHEKSTLWPLNSAVAGGITQSPLHSLSPPPLLPPSLPLPSALHPLFHFYSFLCMAVKD